MRFYVYRLSVRRKIFRRILSARFSVTPDGGRADSRFGQEGFSELARRNLKITVKRLNETALSGKAEFVGDFYYGETFIHQQVGRMDNFGFDKVFRQGYAVIFFEFSANISVAVRNIRNKIRNGILPSMISCLTIVMRFHRPFHSNEVILLPDQVPSP